MDSSLQAQLEWYRRHGTDGLTLSQLQDYIWHVKQLELHLLTLYNEKQLRAPIGRATRGG